MTDTANKIMLGDEANALPAFSISAELNSLLKSKNKVIVTAAPGAGKSTVLPLTILGGLGLSGKILMLEPRRLAAKQVAARMAYLLGEKVGKTVGYRVRFDKCVSADTKIEVLTEGILTRMLVDDPTLDGVDVVVFDEFHERSLASDVALALTREAQSVVRPDLKIVIMSATIDSDELSRQIDAPVVSSSGRMFDVKVIHSDEEASQSNVAEVTARAICKAHRNDFGDILAFLPGQGEILKCQELLGSSLGDTLVYPLYGQLTPEAQNLAILPAPDGRRKVVLATSIAETSLTIQEIRVVVDSGLCRYMVFDQRNGLSHLETKRISMDMATQRTGRAGRVCNGVCYRLWTLATEHRMDSCRVPEILTADMASTVLDVAAWGGENIDDMPWLTPPPAANVAQADRLLSLLGATDNNGVVTELGKMMAKLPCHPRISRILVNQTDDYMVALAADIAALIEEKCPVSELNDEVDISVHLDALRAARGRKNANKWARIDKVAREYRGSVAEDNQPANSADIGLLIAMAYPERIAAAADSCGRYRLSSGGMAVVDKNSDLTSCKWLAVAEMNAQSGNVFLASKLSPDCLSALSHSSRNVAWDSKRGMLVAQDEVKVGCLLIESRPVANLDKAEAVAAVCNAVPKYGLSMFDFNENVARLQCRIACVAAWHPELDLPDVSTDSLLNNPCSWLPFYLESGNRVLSAVSELKKIDLCQAIWNILDYGQQQSVDRLAPTHLAVPTGSKIRIDYRTAAEAPVLSVRLQECFGLTDTPTVNDGRVPVLMELLSPGFKPVQLTRDLRNFWQSTYFEVKKELKRRYPKHYWPDDPLNAEATRGVKKKS